MARSDLLLNLVRAGMRNEQSLFKQTVEALIAEERAKHHHVLADNLARYLNSSNGASNSTVSSVVNFEGRIANLLVERVPETSFDDLILSEEIRKTCKELVEEQCRADLLRSYDVEPRNRLLFVGPPGNGKTSTAEAIASALMIPFLTVRYDGVIASYLGETALRLRTVFEYVRTRRCVLFFDEADAIAKERGDIHETGEIKRVVSSLLLQIDALPSYVVVITATNHPELLDRAVWRRFQIRITFDKPGSREINTWLDNLQQKIGSELGHSNSRLVAALKGCSYAELSEFSADIYRRIILESASSEPNAIRKIVSTRLTQWQLRSAAMRLTGASRGQ